MRFYLMLNAYWQPLDFELPSHPDGRERPWRRWIDTGRGSPQDISPWQEAPPVTEAIYSLRSHSIAMLYAESKPA